MVLRIAVSELINHPAHYAALGIIVQQRHPGEVGEHGRKAVGGHIFIGIDAQLVLRGAEALACLDVGVGTGDLAGLVGRRVHEVHRQLDEGLGVDGRGRHVVAVPFVDLAFEGLDEVVCELAFVFLIHPVDGNDRVHGAAGDGGLEALRELHHEAHRAAAAAGGAGAEELAAVHLAVRDQRVDEGHLQGVVAVDQLDLLREEGGAVGVVGVRDGEDQRRAGDSLGGERDQAAVGRGHGHQVLVILSSADLPDHQGDVRNHVPVRVLGQVQHVFAGETRKAETAGDAVVQDGDVPLRGRGGRDVEGGIGAAAKLPGNELGPSFPHAVGVERCGVDAQRIARASEYEAVFVVRGGGLAGLHVDEAAGGVAAEVEVGGGQAAQGGGIGDGDLHRIHQQADIADMRIDVGAFYDSLRPAAGEGRQGDGAEKE